MATGDASGTWGTVTNTNLTLIADALGFQSKTVASASTDTLTIPDGTETDNEAISLYVKLTGGNQACTITVGPNTVKKLWIIENATSQVITLTQGSGANVILAAGVTKMIYADGAGSGAALVDALVGLEVGTTLYIKNAATGDDSTAQLFLQTAEADIAANDVLGKINFQAPNEGTGTDAILVAAAIQAKSEGDFSSSSNATSLEFMTGASEAATVKFAIASDGSLSTPTAGTSNVRFGVNAGNSIASGGNYNTVVGDEAGTALTTGDNNVAIGFEALKTEDAHGKNTAIGYQALKMFNAGNHGETLAVGHAAGASLTLGLYNTAVGSGALTIDTKGSRSVAVGTNTLNAQNFTTATDAFNVAVGAFAGTSITTGDSNTLIGALAGDALTIGKNSVAVGKGALGSDVAGKESVAVGNGALFAQNFSTATNSFNVAVGSDAGAAVTTGQYNTLIGALAGDALTDADENVAVGYNSLGTNTLGNRTVAIGTGALSVQNFTTATDSFNTAVGHFAGGAVTTAIHNTLIGGLAGDALTDGSNNIALGKGSLSADTRGCRSVAIGNLALAVQNSTSLANMYNVAVGDAAGGAVTTGIRNTLMGSEAGDALTDSDDNVAIGALALSSDTLGFGSVAIGRGALKTQNYTTATDSRNVAVGHSAGEFLQTGTDNTLIGAQCGDALTTGFQNTALGHDALGACVSGKNNVAVGMTAAESNVDGDQNTIIGALANTAATGGDGANVLGYSVSGAAGYTTLGSVNDDIRAAHGNVTWATVSDERFKKDIVDSTAGLSFINALKPRTFKYKNLGELPETFRAYKADSTDVFKNSYTNHGFIAQEVKTAIDADSSIKDGFRLWDDRPDGSQEVAEAALIPVLTKAVQELSTALDAALARIKTLEDG